MIDLVLRPHVERGGYHLDRFDAYLDGELVVTSRQPLYDGARALLAHGRDPDTLLTIRHYGKDYDSFVPSPLGELAKWKVGESDKDGLRRRRWESFDAPRSRGVASPAAEAVE